METITFEAFPKVKRLYREVIITEKIDGTNASVIITEDGQIAAASRKRLITPENDNFGFAKWVEENKEELLELGPGRHFGEWWGQGIQRGYGVGKKYFSLFNTHRWGEERPDCCEVVPVLASGLLNEGVVEDALRFLEESGSVASWEAANMPYFNAEGVMVFHTHSNTLFKVTFDDEHKGE